MFKNNLFQVYLTIPVYKSKFDIFYYSYQTYYNCYDEINYPCKMFNKLPSINVKLI